jgi:hypothetical protein
MACGLEWSFGLVSVLGGGAVAPPPADIAQSLRNRRLSFVLWWWMLGKVLILLSARLQSIHSKGKL